MALSTAKQVTYNASVFINMSTSPPILITMQRDTLSHLIGGGVGGTMGAVVTCPLEVVKTRLQSSSSGFDGKAFGGDRNVMAKPGIWQCLKQILIQEGLPGMFRGLGPTLVGVAPSRAIYFWAYSSCKERLNKRAKINYTETPLIHILAAATAGMVSSVSTNPIWVVKTRLQLEREKRHISVTTVVGRIMKESGIRGFYLGLTASLYGTTETVLHFVVYEYLKKQMAELLGQTEGQHSLTHFLGFMICGAISKTGATCLAYPHEVARTRLRESGTKYISFWQTIGLVYREEGRAGLYRGLATNLVRQIPNTAVMMATYELTVHLLDKWKPVPDRE